MTFDTDQFVKDLSVDYPFTPRDVPLWTEHYMFFGFDAKPGIGFFLHMGREVFDPAAWRINVMVYLPDDELMVVKCRGRDGHARGPGAGPVRITCLEPGRLWAVEFDGVAQRVRRADNMVSVLRDGPGEPLRFTATLEGVAPLWSYDALAGDVMKDQSWAEKHYEQICRVRGDFTLRGHTVRMDGSGIRDHSPGPRDYAPVISDFWINAAFPSGRAFNATNVRGDYPDLPADSPSRDIRYAYVLDAGESAARMVTLVSGPHLNSLDTPARSIEPDIMTDGLREFRVVLDTPTGREEIHGEILHAVATTYLSPSEELIGTDMDRPDGLQLLTCAARFTWNGEVGYGIRERIARISTLKR